MRPKVIVFFAAAAMLPVPAQAENVISSMVKEVNPCSGLKVDIGIWEIGIDRFKSADIERADVALRGDEVSASFAGKLACQTSDDALKPGNASVRIDARVSANLDGCTVSGVSVGLTDFGGMYGGAISTFSGLIEDAFEGVVREEVKKACTNFVQDL